MRMETLVILAFILMGLGSATVVGAAILTILKMASITTIRVRSAWIGSVAILSASGISYTIALYLTNT